MIRTFFLFSMLFSTTALALDSATEAEYHRLSDKLENLTSRNAWTGAERTYQSMVELGWEMNFDDHWQGAQAARAVGDVTSARERLEICSKMGENKEVLDWLWAVDQNYGTVHLFGDVGEVALTTSAMPFDPNQAASIAFAQAKITETGVFEGLLPKGKYTFGPYDVDVVPMVSSGRVDLRSDDGVKAQKKATKKKKKHEKKGRRRFELR